MAQSRPRVAIVGGGIGGLFAANALTAQGITVSVYEQAPAIGEIGAGVFLTPNSVRHLQRIGLQAAVEKCGARVGRDSHYFRHDGAPIAPVQVTDSSGWNATFGMHRADLVDMLAAALAAGNGACRTSLQRIRAGRRHRAGDRSPTARRPKPTSSSPPTVSTPSLRPYVFPPSQPVFHGSVAYRGLVPHERLPDWPTDRWQMWLGTGRHFLTFPVRAGKLINYVGFVPTDEQMKESWSAPGDPDTLRREFAGWDPRIQQVLAKCTRRFAGRCTIASRCRPGPREG